MDENLYMVIDVTTVEQTKILKVAHLRESALWGRLMKAAGLQVIAPVIGGRGFSKLTLAQLQYLYWNTYQATPSDNYADLLQACVEATVKYEVDTTDIRWLEAECAKLVADEEGTPEETYTDENGVVKVIPAKKARKAKGTATPKTPKEPKAPKEPKTPKEPKDPSGRPAATSSTGAVWVIADECLAELGAGVDLKVLRKMVGDRCEKAGLNPGTVSVQFGKWKNVTLTK